MGERIEHTLLPPVMKFYPARTLEEQNLRMGYETCVRRRQENWEHWLYMNRQKAVMVLYGFNHRLMERMAVSHVVQSIDSDSDAFILVIETTVHWHPSGWGKKDRSEQINVNKNERNYVLSYMTPYCEAMYGDSSSLASPPLTPLPSTPGSIRFRYLSTNLGSPSFRVSTKH